MFLFHVIIFILLISLFFKVNFLLNLIANPPVLFLSNLTVLQLNTCIEIYMNDIIIYNIGYISSTTDFVNHIERQIIQKFPIHHMVSERNWKISSTV